MRMSNIFTPSPQNVLIKGEIQIHEVECSKTHERKKKNSSK